VHESAYAPRREGEEHGDRDAYEDGDSDACSHGRARVGARGAATRGALIVDHRGLPVGHLGGHAGAAGAGEVGVPLLRARGAYRVVGAAVRVLAGREVALHRRVVVAVGQIALVRRHAHTGAVRVHRARVGGEKHVQAVAARARPRAFAVIVPRARIPGVGARGLVRVAGVDGGGGGVVAAAGTGTGVGAGAGRVDADGGVSASGRRGRVHLLVAE